MPVGLGLGRLRRGEKRCPAGVRKTVVVGPGDQRLAVAGMLDQDGARGAGRSGLDLHGPPAPSPACRRAPEEIRVAAALGNFRRSRLRAVRDEALRGGEAGSTLRSGRLRRRARSRLRPGFRFGFRLCGAVGPPGRCVLRSRAGPRRSRPANSPVRPPSLRADGLQPDFAAFLAVPAARPPGEKTPGASTASRSRRRPRSPPRGSPSAKLSSLSKRALPVGQSAIVTGGSGPASTE